jgi:hypothetical protein
LAAQTGKNIGRTLTLLVLFVVTIVVVLVIFAYFDGLFKFVSAGAPSMTTFGYLALPGGAGSTGDLAVQVTDTSHVAITAVTFACPTTQFESSDCGGLQINLNGSELSTQNELKYGQTASGSGPVQSAPGTSFTPGVAVTVTVTATFSNGNTLSETLILPAQPS